MEAETRDAGLGGWARVRGRSRMLGLPCLGDKRDLVVFEV